jgi:hypothetical protein
VVSSPGLDRPAESGQVRVAKITTMGGRGDTVLVVAEGELIDPPQTSEL